MTPTFSDKTDKRRFFYALFMPLGLLGSTFLASCRGEAPTEVTNISRDQVGIERGKDVEILYSDSARLKVRITGPTMLYYTLQGQPRQEFSDGVVAYFYDDNQQEQSQLSGKYALRDEMRKRVVIRDSVVWESAIDGRLETSELIWDETTNTIKSSKFTKITRKDETIWGYNFETDDKLTHWRLLSPAGSLKVKNADFQ